MSQFRTFVYGGFTSAQVRCISTFKLFLPAFATRRGGWVGTLWPENPILFVYNERNNFKNKLFDSCAKLTVLADTFLLQIAKFFGQDPDPDPLVRVTDPDPATDPFIIKQK